MRGSARRPLFIAAAATLALVGAALPATAANDSPLDSGGNPPGGWVANPQAYSSMFGGAGVGAPQGTVIADSGFRPYPHGFPLPNWGSAEEFALNALVYGTPERVTLDQFEKGQYAGPPALNSLALRRSLGNGVCRDPKDIDPKTGQCDLILGAELLAQMIETGAEGGHCFGFAASAAALYNGQLPANQVGASALGINAANPMDQPAVETITRLWGAQFLSPTILEEARGGQSPTQVVQTLIRDLPSGQVPYVLTLLGEEGGHAITPYAVTDRGDGMYDIAVYDNNFPFRALAVTVDTEADTFLYTSATNPNAPDYTWSTADEAEIALIPLDDVLAVQPCPVCRGKDNGTLVAFNAVEAANAEQVDISLIDTKGQELSDDLYRVLAPLNPDTEEHVSLPLLVVEPGVPFGVVIQTGQLAAQQPIEVYALSNGASEYLLLQRVRSNGTYVFGVSGTETQFLSDGPSSPRMQQLYDGTRSSYDVNGHPLALPAGVTSHQKWDRTKRTVRYWSEAKGVQAWNVQVTGVREEGEAGWVAVGVKVPAGAEILVDYSRATATVAPSAWVVDEDGSRTAISMQKVTASLIAKDRKDIFVSRGPS